MVVPPVGAVHTQSKVGGSRVNITFGWISMSIRGVINRANEMEKPAEGWAFVEAKFRDEVKAMLDNQKQVDKSMVEHSEALLLEIYPGDGIRMESDRGRREAQQSSFFRVRPEDREDDSWRENRGDPGEWTSQIKHPLLSICSACLHCSLPAILVLKISCTLLFLTCSFLTLYGSCRFRYPAPTDHRLPSSPTPRSPSAPPCCTPACAPPPRS
jgi:hypothetical protein